MSANTAHANGGVLIYNGEIILLYCDGVELTVEEISEKEFAGTRKGRIYLTTHRMIFLNKSEKDNLQSFSFPFFSMSAVELEQPVFGANYIKGLVHAQAGGNWTGKATFKLKFFKGGAIEFGQAMLRAAKMANQYMPPAPPPYTPHQGPYYPAPPPSYMAPAGGVNGFVPPTNVFPDAPPANSVYTMDMPPPYPGIYPPPYAYPPGSQMYPNARPNGLTQPVAGPPPGSQMYPNARPNGLTQPVAGPPPGSQKYPNARPNGLTQPVAGPPPESQKYPHARPNGLTQPLAGPPPPGFGAPSAYPTQPGSNPAYQPGAYPPPYSAQGQPGAIEQFSGTTQQPPSNETKGSAPPIYDFYQNPYNQHALYSTVNEHAPGVQGPPPPYSEEKKDK